MKTITKLMLAGAALAAGGVANAATISVVPTASTGSDLVLFVTDTANNATFVQDLGVTVNSLGVTAATVAADAAAGNEYSIYGLGTVGSLNNPVGTNGVDTSLVSFLNANSGGTFTYGILGAATGNGQTLVSGQERFVATFTGNAVAGTGNIGLLYTSEPSSSQAGGYAQTVNSYFSAVNLGTAGPFGVNGTSGGSAAGITGVPTNAALGTPMYLYEVSTYNDGNTTDANFYGSAVAITVSAAGVISGFATGSSGTVPLPAAVWLFGSGLLGMFGIRRRRGDNVAVVAA
jgi:hypothetical protein